MGHSVLDLALKWLRKWQFEADVAFPGQKYPRIEDTVAAVHIEKVDRANLTVTVGVSIISPAALGGTACEMAALRATEALRWSGALCVQQGCSYDGVSQVYVVPIQATYSGITEEDDMTLGPGFRVYLNDTLQKYVTAITAQEARDWRAEFSMGETGAVGVSLGTRLWEITLEELIPIGSPENAEPEDDFEIKLVMDIGTEYFYHCRWTSMRRELTSQGLRKVKKGLSMERREI